MTFALLGQTKISSPPRRDRVTGPQGRAFTIALPSAPFPDPRRADGYVLDDVIYDSAQHYQDSSILVYFPKAWRDGAMVNLSFFFHGWYSSIGDCLDRFDLLNEFDKSEVNAVLVVPETAKNAPDSFGGKLEDEGGFGHLVHDLTAELHRRGLIQTTRVGKVVVAGHSGAYRVVGEILIHGGVPVHSVILFDALYGRLDDYSQWLMSHGTRLFSVYSDESETRELNQDLMQRLSGHGVPLALDDEAQEGERLPESTRAVFYRSDRDHYGVVAAAGQLSVLIHQAFEPF